MISMTSRERVRCALNHKQPDRAPVDFGATVVTGISASALYRLRKALELEDHPIKIIDPYQMLGEVDHEIMRYLHVDVVSIPARTNLFGYENAGYKPWILFDGTPVLVPGGFNTVPDENGDILMYPQGDRSAPASGRMPKGGYYFDAIIRQQPIDDERLHPEDNLEEFSLLDDDALRIIEAETDRLYRETDYAIVGSAGASGLGDIAYVPGPMLKFPKGIRDVEEWYVSLLTRQDYIKEVFDRQTDMALQNFKLYKQAVGNKIDVLFLCGTDLGTQNAPFCSVELFRELYLPFQKKMTSWIHQNTDWKVLKHSCGAIEPLIPELIEAGFDILNPVQCSAAGMDPQKLKEKYGDRIVFWGGGVDTQFTLPFGKPEEVADQVRSRIETFNRGGGFVFNAIHNVQAGTPAENLMAMADAIGGLCEKG